jgi:hypothetical protein
MNIPYDILAATNCIDKVKAATALFSEGDKEIINVILSRYEREIEKWGNYQVPYYTNTERGAVIAGVKRTLKAQLKEGFDKNEAINIAVANTDFKEETIQEKVYTNKRERQSWRNKETLAHRNLIKEMKDTINIELVRQVLDQNPNLITKIK